MDGLLLPFSYDYMRRAILVAGLVGGVCGFLSGFLILKGWSFMGDALAHAVVPGVAVAYLLAWPFAVGAFVAGVLAAAGIALIRRLTMLRSDAVIGLVFTTFFAAGLVIAAVNPVSVRLQTIIMGNVLAISDRDLWQVLLISGAVAGWLLLDWRNLMVVLFDDVHARALGLDPRRHVAIFFALLAAATVAALQTVGALLVVAMVITPGATAYLLVDRFGRMLALGAAIGAFTGALGAWMSYFLDGATGGIIVLFQTGLFVLAFLFAPRHGRLAQARRASRTGSAHTGPVS